MVSKILETTQRKVTDRDGVAQISIPKLWLGILDIKIDDDVTLGLMESDKYGRFLAVWSKNQRKE